MRIRALPVTFSLISACVFIYIGVALSATSSVPLNIGLVNQPAVALANGALIPSLVANGEVWRLLTSMFLHSGFIHIALNMLSLYFLGAFAEPLFRRGRFFALYMLSGLSGGIAYLYFGNFDTPAVGASGAIFGILGGILGFAVRSKSFSWRNPIVRQLLILLVINLYIGFSIPNVSNTAHLGGLAGGFAFGLLTTPAIRRDFRKRTALIPTLTVAAAEIVLVAVWMLLPR